MTKPCVVLAPDGQDPMLRRLQHDALCVHGAAGSAPDHEPATVVVLVSSTHCGRVEATARRGVVVVGRADAVGALARIVARGHRVVISDRLDPAEVTRAVSAAREGFVYLGADVAAALVALAVPSRRPPRPEATALTAREQQVLEYLARGQSNAEIATSLCVSVATVKNHVHSILGKLGVNSRERAVATCSATIRSESAGPTAGVPETQD